jgi:molybdate transport system substrate-binding protein
MKKAGLVYLLIALFYTGLTSFAVSASAKEITVSASIVLKNAFEEIGKLYESNTNTGCVFNFGAAGNLLKQIAGGAPVDVFASAAKKFMDEADSEGLTIAGTRAEFTSNSMVLVVPAGSKTALNSFEGLNSAEIKKIAVGNPKTVSAGEYAEDVFHFYKISASIQDKFIYTENVRQVLDYVARNEVDAGVVFATDAAVRSKEVKIVAAAPETSHKQAVYTVAVVKGSKYEAEARAFIALLLSGEGQAVLKNHGFKVVR